MGKPKGSKNSYFTNVSIQPRPKLNGDNRHCPRCGHLLFRDMNDLACSIRCGWRESCYFRDDDSMDQVLLKRLMFNSVDAIPK